MNLFKKIISFFKKEEPPSYGVSCDRTIKLKDNPILPDLKQVKFYRPSSSIGTFEIRRIEITPEGQGQYVIVYDSQVDKEFRISLYWFNRLFEEIKQPEIKLGSHHE